MLQYLKFSSGFGEDSRFVRQDAGPNGKITGNQN